MNDNKTGASLVFGRTAADNRAKGQTFGTAYRVQNNQKRDVYTIVNEKFIEMLERGVVPWRPCVEQDAEAFAAPINGYSGYQYRGINVLMLMGTAIDRGFDSNRWYTMKQINMLGGRVQKDQKGTPIVFAKKIERKEDGKVVLDKKGNAVLRYFVTYTYGWNLSQTTLKIETEDQGPGLDPLLQQNQTMDAIRAYLEREGIETTNVGSRPTYNFVHDVVNLPDFTRAISPERWFSSAFHEIVHSTGHNSRLDRFKQGCNMSHGSKERALEELIAEIGAAYQMAEHGIFEKSQENMGSYIHGWLQVFQSDKRILFTASTKAQAAVAFIKTGAAT